MQQNFLLKTENLRGFLDAASKKMAVFVPCLNENNASSFLQYAGQELCLKEQTLFSPKKVFFPPSAKEFAFKEKKALFEIKHFLEKPSQMIFAVRPCDCHAINAFEKVFLESRPVDPLFKAVMENTLIVALQCRETCENGFCKSLGTSKAVGHDLLFVEAKNGFFVEVASGKGNALVREFRKFFGQTSLNKPRANFECSKAIDTKNLKEILDKNFFHRKWETEGKKCLSCTACTQVCPSCYCFLSLDSFVLGSDDSERFRQWDSCQLQRFTRIAGNNIFRPGRAARLRQFVMHKLSYFQESHGKPLCVGCGRCISACPVGIDLTEIASVVRRRYK